MKILWPDEMQALDALAIERGADSLQLMEEAGRATAAQARDMLSSCLEKRVVVVSAKGKNGGDGLVAARHLAEWGARVEIFLLDEPAGLHPDARANLERLGEAGQSWKPYGRDELLRAMAPADLVIDAIFGIGFKGVAGGIYGECIEAVNGAGRPVLAVDLPSGVDGRTGGVDGPAIRADRTVTFAYPKTGLYLYPGAALAGDLVVRDIGIPAMLVEEAASSRMETIDRSIEKEYPARRPDAHKGECGRVLIVAGSPGLTGAAALAARAALRSGAGVVTLGVAAGLNDIFEIKLTEAMTLSLPEGPPGYLSEAALEPVLAAAEGFDALAVGPGLGKEEGSARLVEGLLARYDGPLLLDADGLNCMAGRPGHLADREAPLVITPHPGELSRLTGRSTREIQEDRIGAAVGAAADFGCVVVLKGAHTVVAHEKGWVGINTSGHPGMATAGSGDVLAGCIATFLAQGLEPYTAACCGVYLHGKAGELAAHITGEVGMVAGDILSHLPLARSRGNR